MATKNDSAWQNLFDRYDILQKIHRHGFYEIESRIINTERESRLMAKFDHHVNLPQIFKQHNLSILPVSRTRYVIGKFDSYMKVNYSETIPKIPVNFPYHIESIDHTNLYSESSALHCAFVSGIIDMVAGEEVVHTVSGRMSSESFNFNIRNIPDGSKYPVSVKNSQLEIDAGYEGAGTFLLVEAKNFSVEDFLIRQLYYPYRLWRNKLNKNVIPALMTYSNDIFSFFIYEFQQPDEYNSLILKKQKNFIIDPERIDLSEIVEILNGAAIIPEPEVPFPQADKFERVIDLLGLLAQSDLTKNQITGNYQFDIRQTDYYTNSAIYLGLALKYKDPETKEITYTLTDEGLSVMKRRHKAKSLSLVKSILRHEAFHKAFRKWINNGYQPNLDMVCDIMRHSKIYNVGMESETIPRRAKTVIGWLSWIYRLVDQH